MGTVTFCGTTIFDGAGAIKFSRGFKQPSVEHEDLVGGGSVLKIHCPSGIVEHELNIDHFGSLASWSTFCTRIENLIGQTGTLSVIGMSTGGSFTHCTISAISRGESKRVLTSSGGADKYRQSVTITFMQQV